MARSIAATSTACKGVRSVRARARNTRTATPAAVATPRRTRQTATCARRWCWRVGMEGRTLRPCRRGSRWATTTPAGISPTRRPRACSATSTRNSRRLCERTTSTATPPACPSSAKLLQREGRACRDLITREGRACRDLTIRPRQARPSRRWPRQARPSRKVRPYRTWRRYHENLIYHAITPRGNLLCHASIIV